MKWTVISLPAVLLLGACGSDPTPTAAPAEGTASGEILDATISDAMLPLDTVTSHSPPMKDAAGPGAEPSDDDGTEAAPGPRATAPADAPQDASAETPAENSAADE